MTQIVERPFPFGKLRGQDFGRRLPLPHASSSPQFDYIDITKAAAKRIYP
jgi:hypothetical protein